MSRYGKRVLAIISGVGGFLISIGIIQVKFIEIDATTSARRLKFLVAGAVFLVLALLGSIVFESLASSRARKRALAVLKRTVSTSTIEMFLGQSRSDVRNPVVLRQASCRVIASGVGDRLDLLFKWRLEGVNTSNERLSWLSFALTGSHPTFRGEIAINAKSEAEGEHYDGQAIIVRDLPRLKEIRIPLGTNGVDTGEAFTAEFCYGWPKLLDHGADYFFFRPSSFAHSIRVLDFSLEVDASVFSQIMLFVVKPEEGAISFKGLGARRVVADGCAVFTATFEKLRSDYVYVVLLFKDEQLNAVRPGRFARLLGD